MPKAIDILGSGALGLGPKLAIENPDLLRGFGVLGNLAANKLEDREEKKKAGMAAATPPAQPGMKKGGKVKMKSASARADGCAQRGKTRGKIV